MNYTISGTTSSQKMKIFAATLILTIIIGVVSYVISSSERQKVSPAAFAGYIQAYTSGIISKSSTIRIKLTRDIADSAEIGKESKYRMFDFTPAIRGKSYWVDARTIEFIPEKTLPSGEKYEGEFYLDKLFKGLPDSLESFWFEFQTIQQNFEITVDRVKAYDDNDQSLKKILGTLTTADIADSSDIKELLSAEQDGKKLEISWLFDQMGKLHKFTVENVARTNKNGKVVLKWTGKPFNINKEGTQEIEIAPLGEFKLMRYKAVQGEENYIFLEFSDPLDENQNLEGLITFDLLPPEMLRFLIDGSELRVYPPDEQVGEKKIIIEQGLKNLWGNSLTKRDSIFVTFEELKPAVRFVGKGVILPSTNGLILPFESVNLEAVDITIYKIYENNIAQFLQVNSLDGGRELRRVAHPNVRKTIFLTTYGIADLHKWNRFTLDLSEIIKTEPGAIYRVSIGFRKKYSIYNCGEIDTTDTEMDETAEQDDWDKPLDNGGYYWDEEDDYWYYEDYDWEQRDNPCHSSYYTSERTIYKNVLASDLGLIAKRGNSGNLMVIVSDLVTTDPLSDVILEVYDFQQQQIARAVSNSDGIANIYLNKNPFLLIAKLNNQRGYLKLDDGSSLSLSNFDVSGANIDKGLKGFIYAERDVWRPGDSIYTTFILEDKSKILPESHPVIFELVNPKGQSVYKITKTSGLNGVYDFFTCTDSEAPTGNWMAKIKVGGALFTKTLKIETVKPNRLKINFAIGADKIVSGKNNVNGFLDVKWLHGAVAANIKADFAVTLYPVKTEFKKYPDFRFDDPIRKFNGESQLVFSGKLNDEGKAKINATVKAENSPGMLVAYFDGKAIEPGGDFSIDRFSIPYYPYNTFVGIQLPKKAKSGGMLVTDEFHTVKIATVDTDGNPVSRDNIIVELYKLKWRWWWDQSNEIISNYYGNIYYKPIETDTISTKNGNGTWKLKINYPDWGRFLIRVHDPSSGHYTGYVVYLDWPQWVSRDNKEIPGGATMLTFSSDKEKYKVGDDVKLTIPSSESGRAFISIENGSKVISTFWTKTQKGETPYSFKVTNEMSPNIYVHVSLLQPHSQTVNDLPMRLYGILPITIDNPETHLEPVISMPSVLEPEGKVTIKIKEKKGKPMTYTVAVVDEGLLDLTRFKTPDPWAYFYAREALGVKTWDLYESVMGAFGGNLERLLAIGGDEALRKKKSAKANRFKPVVQFFGPLELGKGKTDAITFTMPNYIGSVRTMVVAANEGAYGNAEKTTPVRKALMALGSLPRVLGPDEEVSLPVTIFAMDKKVSNVNIKVTTNDKIYIDGSSTASLSFSQPGEKMAFFKLKIKNELGIAKVKIIATSGKEKSVYEVEVDVRNPNLPITEVAEALIEPGKTWYGDFKAIGIEGTNSATLELSSVPPINLGQRLHFLMQYPYGCIEQTVSSVFPQLYLDNFLESDSKKKAEIEKNIKVAIMRLQQFQTSDGGFAYWPGLLTSDEWGSNYAGHFMLEAQNKGYYIPAQLLSRWNNYQKRKASLWFSARNGDDIIQAYRLYTLALAKIPQSGAMNRLMESKNLTAQAKWRLAAAYSLAGQPEAANKLIWNTPIEVSKLPYYYTSYGSELRDKAMILETICLMNKKEKGFALMKSIAAALSAQNNWLSTQTTAYCLIAAAKFTGNKSLTMNYSIKLNKSEWENGKSNKPLHQQKLTIDEKKNNNISISNKGKGTLYARVILHGTPGRSEQIAAANNLKFDIEYTNSEGKKIVPEKLQQSTDFTATVTIYNPGTYGDYKNLALAQIFPSGWEIINERLSQAPEANINTKYDYRDIRDDRVYTFFDLKAGERKVFTVKLNASYTGKYFLPSTICEAMYDNSIYSRAPGKMVEVVK